MSVPSGASDALCLADPAFGLCADAAIEQVGFEFVEPGKHLGVDVQHQGQRHERIIRVQGHRGCALSAHIQEALCQEKPSPDRRHTRMS
jgi:hypothetical protein